MPSALREDCRRGARVEGRTERVKQSSGRGRENGLRTHVGLRDSTKDTPEVHGFERNVRPVRAVDFLSPIQLHRGSRPGTAINQGWGFAKQV